MKFKKVLALLLAAILVVMTVSAAFTVSADSVGETFDTFDQLTLADFGLNPGQYSNALPENKQVSYSATSASYSYVLKFYWRANLTAGSGASELCISPDGKWNHGYGLWFRGDGLFFCWKLDDAKAKLAAITSGDHLVEFGRKLVATGDNAGKYYVYVKVDDVLLRDAYTTYGSGSYTMNNTMYIRGADISNQRFANYYPPEEYEAYDEIGYEDLLKDGNPVGNQTSMAGGNTFTYNKTSPTGSVILKYRWTIGSVPKFQLSFDKVDSTTPNYMFGVQLEQPDTTYTNGKMWLRPGYTTALNMPTMLLTGSSHNIEFARLKVASGTNAGKYYIYIKIDDALIAEDYVNAGVVDENGQYVSNPRLTTCTLSNEIFITHWGSSGNKISAYLEAENYETYDEIGYEDLLKDGSPVGAQTAMSGGNTFTYNKTSPTGSVILRYGWTVGSVPKFQISFDKVDSTTMNYMFGAQLEESSSDYTNGKMWLRPGYTTALNMPMTIAAGSFHNVEFARLKVTNGINAGKYYVYIKIDDVKIAESYIDADVVNANGQYVSNPRSTTCTLSNEIFITHWGSSGNVMSAYGEIEDPDNQYYAYDEIGYDDLMDENGQALGAETAFNGAKTFTYNRTSPTGSVILKYRWTAGSIPKFQLSFDHAYESNGTTKSIDYMFGLQLSAPSTNFPNGEMWLRPGYGQQLNLSEPLETGSVYDIEFARLKVASGANKDKYYVYIKINDVIISEGYTSANIVDSNNQYTSGPGVDGSTDITISNKIFMTFYGTYGNKISETWENGRGYTVYFYANGETVDSVQYIISNPTIVGHEPAVPAVPNTTGVWEYHPVSNLSGDLTVNAIYTVTVPTAGTDISLNTFDGAEVDLNTDIVNEYRATPMAEQSDYIRNYHSNTSGYQDHQNITFSWSDLGDNDSYTVYFADNANFENAFITTATGTELVNKVGIFTPGKTYFWFVTGNDTGENSAVDTFTAADTPVRYISSGAVTNVRDMGGYTTTDGKTINYGLVYRGASLDENHSYVDAMARNVFNYLGMKTEIELRGEAPHYRVGWDAESQSVYNIGATGYSPILTIDSNLKAQYVAAFEAMADRSNYPFYFHCSAGADRTGTFAYLLNGLLGVPYEELREDYELTSFSDAGRRLADYWTEDDSFDAMHESLMEQYDDGSGNVSLAIERFLTEYVGVEQSTLDSIKEIMLESDPMDLDCSGTVNAGDLLMLKQAILADSTEVKYDLNEDNAVDVRDLVFMKKYFSGNTFGMISLQVGATPTDRTVVWCMDSAKPGKIQLAKKADMTGGRFPTVFEEYTAVLGSTTISNMYSHTVELTDLDPNTEYVYRVGNGVQWSAVYEFETQNNADGSVNFLVAGDSQIGVGGAIASDTAGWEDALEKGLAQTPDAAFLISLGDQTDSPDNNAYAGFFSPDVLKSLPMASVVGNHELGATYSSFFKMPNVSAYGVSSAAGAGSGDYWFVYGNVLFMVLNTNNATVAEHQQFMSEAIAANPTVTWKVVSMHQTLFGATHNPSAMNTLRATLAPVFSNLGIDVVLSAHDHSYLRTYMMDGTTPIIPDGEVTNSVTDPDDGQVLYVSLNSSSGSRYFEWDSNTYPYVAFRNQENVPNISSVSITDTAFTITTYRTTDMSVMDTFTINKTSN